MKKHFLEICFIGLCFLPLFLQAQMEKLGRETRVDSVLASVNGEPVTLLDVILESGKDEVRLASMFSGERLYAETSKLRKQILDEIVVRKLVYLQYKANPFKIEKQYVEDMVDTLAATMGDGTREGLRKRAESMGTSLDELREKALEKLAVDAILSEFCDRQVYVTPKEIYEEYENNPEEWTRPSMIDLQLLQILRDGGRSGSDSVSACEKISKLLENAEEETFRQLVRSNSDAPNAADGGSMGGLFDVLKLRPEFAAALKEHAPVKSGTVIGPVETPEAFYFIRVAAVQDAVKVPFEEVSEKIKQRLNVIQKSKRRAEYATRLKSKALIRYYF